MKIIAVIPARYGSTRFKGKPLAKINGVPMIQMVYERTRLAKGVSKVVVATDDRRILEAVAAFGGKALITSDTNRSGTDRAGEVAEKEGLFPDDIVINVQGDQPLIDPRCIEELIDTAVRGPRADIWTPAIQIVNEADIADIGNVKVVCDTKGYALYFSRSPIPFDRDRGDCVEAFKHLGVYAYTRRFLDTFKTLKEGKLERLEKLEQLRALEHGYRIRVVITRYNSPEVDTPEDIGKIENLLRSGQVTS